MRRLHARLNRWLWERTLLLAIAIVVGWVTGSFYTGLTVAVILIVGLFVCAGLLSGFVEWRAGKSFKAPRGRVWTTREVMEEGWAILLVTHGTGPSPSWYFVHQEDDLASEPVSVHIQQLLERDPSIAGLAQLPPGSRAWRSAEDDDWDSEPIHAPAVE